jgi:hypothetical protein
MTILRSTAIIEQVPVTVESLKMVPKALNA